MTNAINRIMGILFLLFVLMAVLAGTAQQESFFAAATTLGATFYHFGVRLAVGWILNKILQNRADYRKEWYQPHKIETWFYKAIKIKNRMPSCQPEHFSPFHYPWDEIAQATCQTEIIHKIIILLRFLPMAAAVFFGNAPIFLAPSVYAACVDLIFVMIQRYNRPRIVKRLQQKPCGNGETPGKIPAFYSRHTLKSVPALRVRLCLSAHKMRCAPSMKHYRMAASRPTAA